MKYVFDSNILIAISLGDEKVLSFLNNKKDDEFFVSVLKTADSLIVATANSINGMLLTRDKDIFISTPGIVIQL